MTPVAKAEGFKQFMQKYVTNS